MDKNKLLKPFTILNISNETAADIKTEINKNTPRMIRLKKKKITFNQWVFFFFFLLHDHQSSFGPQFKIYHEAKADVIDSKMMHRQPISYYAHIYKHYVQQNRSDQIRIRL